MMQVAYSRPSAVASRLLGTSTAGQLLKRPVLLTGDVKALQSAGGRSTFLAALSLLTRFCSDLSVFVPDGTGMLEERTRALAQRIRYAGMIQFLAPKELDYDVYHAILNVGATHRLSLPWTSIACNGWTLQACSSSGPVSLDFSRFNPAACLAAASLGSTEVFKRLLGVVDPRGKLFGNEVFSLFTYSPDTSPGPDILAPLRLDCILVGHGAIGNGVRHVLLELPLEGWLAVVDCQAAGEENWGTYIDLERAGFARSKAELGCAGQRPAVNTLPCNLDVLRLREKVGIEIPYPDVVLGALDNIEARHALQQLWPNVVIDGAIDDLTCQVSRHPWGPDTACLQCLFRELPGEDSAVVVSRLTGLTIASAARQDDVVTQADIDVAQGEKKAFLAAHIGQQKCSVIRKAQVEALTAGAASFSPSAPFVACLSGSMVAAEFIRFRMGLESPLDPRFQCNVLLGPSAGNMLDQSRRADCFCSSRKYAIEASRQRRAGMRIP